MHRLGVLVVQLVVLEVGRCWDLKGLLLKDFWLCNVRRHPNGFDFVQAGNTMKTNIGWLDNCVSSLPKSVQHVWTSFERKRFCPYKLHCYQIPVLARVRFGDGLMVKPEPVTSSHFMWQRWCMLSLFKNWNGVHTLVPRHTIFWLHLSYFCSNFNRKCIN